MGAMARTIVASKVSSIRDGDASQVGTHPKDDDPAWVDHSILVVLGVAELCQIHSLLSSNFFLCAMTDKQGLPSPLEGHIFALGDVGELDLNLG